MSLRIIRRKIRSGFVRARLAWAPAERFLRENKNQLLDMLRARWEQFRPPPPRPERHRPSTPPDRKLPHDVQQLVEEFHKTVAAVSASMPWPSAEQRPERRVVLFAGARIASNLRIECEARALARQGFEVVVVGVDHTVSSRQSSLPNWGPGVTFDISPASTPDALNAAPYFYSRALIEAASKHQAFAIQATDLSNALIVLEASRRTKALPVIDLSTWESESASRDPRTKRWLPHNEALAAALREIEGFAVRRAAAVITSSDAIARALEVASSVGDESIGVVRTIPDASVLPNKAYRLLKEQAGLPERAFTVVCVADPTSFNMLQPVIMSLRDLPDVHLVIRASSTGSARAYYRRIARQAGTSKRVVFLEPVPLRDLAAASIGADIGLWTYPDISKNHKSVLPGEIFSYAAAGLPLATANLREPAQWLDRFKCGVTFAPYDPHSIANAIKTLQMGHTTFAKASDEAKRALVEESESDWRNYADIYDRLWRVAVSKYDAGPITQPSTTTPMRVLHAPCNFGNQSWVLSRAERKLGLKSEVVVNYLNAFDQPADRVLGTVGGKSADHLTARKTALSSAPYDFDVYHYYFGRSLASWDDIDELASESFSDLKRARDLGKPIIMTLQGCDVRLAGESNKRNAFTPCAPNRCPAYESCLSTYDHQRRRLIQNILPLCDKVFYLNPELGHFVPNATFLPYASVDIWKVQPQQKAANAIPRILHAPSLAGIKGTAAILAALESLSKRHAFEVVLVENRTHEEAMTIYQTADIAIDQIFAGWYGGFSVELMAMGIPVMSYLREQDFANAPATIIRDLPVLNIRPDRLEQDIEAVLLRRAEWAGIGQASRSFVERWHDPEKIAAWMMKVYAAPKSAPAFDPDAA